MLKKISKKSEAKSKDVLSRKHSLRLRFCLWREHIPRKAGKKNADNFFNVMSALTF